MLELTETLCTNLPFGARRLGLDDRIGGRPEIGLEVLFREAGLADAGMDDARFLDAELTWPHLASVTAFVTSGVTVPSLGLGISPLGPSTLPRRPTMPIMSGVAMTRSKSMVPPWMVSIRSFCFDDVGAGLVRVIGLVALGEDRDANVLAGALGQRHDAAHHLVGMARVDAEVERDLDSLVELGRGVFLDDRNRLIDAIKAVAFDGASIAFCFLVSLATSLALLHHVVGPSRGRCLR